MADAAHNPVGPVDHQSRRDKLRAVIRAAARRPFLVAVLGAVPASLLLGFGVFGAHGRIGGSRAAFGGAASAVTFAILYVVIVVVRAASRGRVVSLKFPWGGGLDAADDDAATPAPEEMAQHEALATQAKTVEATTEELRRQLRRANELLDREKDRGDRLEAELRESRARSAGLEAKRGEEEIHMTRPNATHEDRPPG